MKNGKKFGGDFGSGGDDYDSFIVEYDQDNNEHIFTGIIYDCYENGNLASYYRVINGIKNGEMVHFYPNGQVKEIKQIDKNTLEGIQKEFYENGVLKLVEYRDLGRLVSFEKYDEQGNLSEEKKESMEYELTYAEKRVNNENEELFKREQEKWISKISLKNNFKLADIQLVAGIDIAYWTKGEKDYGVCCIVVIDYITKQIIEEVEFWGQIDVPYISGYLAFRELPLVMEAVKKLQCKPDLFMFDGNGYLHYRNMGIATHASFYLKRPTIGVAKSYLKIKDTDFKMPKNEIGDFTYIEVGGEVYGAVLRTRKDVKPIFISSGNWIDMETSIKITLHFVEKNSRLPITTRYADLATHESRRKYSQ